MSLLKLSKHYAEKYIKGRNWENIEKILQTTDLYAFNTLSLRFLYVFGMVLGWFRYDFRWGIGGEVFVRVLYGNLYEMCKRKKDIPSPKFNFIE